MRLNVFKLARAMCVALMVTYCSISAAGQGVVTLKKQKYEHQNLLKLLISRLDTIYYTLIRYLMIKKYLMLNLMRQTSIK